MSIINVAGRKFPIKNLLVPMQDQKEIAGSYAERTTMSSMIYDDWSTAFNSFIDLELFEKQKIRQWRLMALNGYVDFAIQNIVCEMLTLDEQSAFPIDIDLSNTTFSQKIRQKIHDAFDNILKLLQFNNKPFQILYQWFIDGKVYFFLNRAKNGKDICSIVMLDPLRIVPYVEREDTKGNINSGHNEFFLDGKIRKKYHYQDMMIQNTVLEIDEKDMIVVPSGIMDSMNRIWISYLEKAYIPLNQLTSMEDAILVYRIARAPERRVFYIDVGELPKSKAEEYMQEVIANLRNTMEFDKETGTVAEKRKHMNIMEDLFLSRRCLSLLSKIKLIDGRELTLQEIIDEYKFGIKNYVYSISPEGEIVPGLISWAGITKRNTEALDIHLDNDEIITCTPDHKFILKDGTKIEAQYLNETSELMQAGCFSDDTSSFRTIKKIEKHDGLINTGTITVDENHIEHDYHNFALSSGIFVCNSGTNTTSVETLPSGQALGNLEDLDYFQNKLFRSLNVPFSRWNEGTSGANALGRVTEINRDELLFTKFVARLRINFNMLFFELLKLVCTQDNIVDVDEFEENFDAINFIWNTTNMFFELKELDILQERMNALEKVWPYCGRIFSINYIRKNILRQTDEEIREIDKQIAKEKEIMIAWSAGSEDYSRETVAADKVLDIDVENPNAVNKEIALDTMDDEHDEQDNEHGINIPKDEYGNAKEPEWMKKGEKEGILKMPPKVSTPPILDIKKDDIKSKEDNEKEK